MRGVGVCSLLGSEERCLLPVGGLGGVPLLKRCHEN